MNARCAGASLPPAFSVPQTRSGDWWPGGMGHPHLAGTQNGMRYAYFARAARLAIEHAGHITLYDTSGHDVRGVCEPSQPHRSPCFEGADGPIDLSTLPAVVGLQTAL